MAQTKPKAGQFYGVSNNGTDGQFLKTDGAGGMSWAAPIQDPTITSIDYPGSQTAADPAGGESVIINGTLFASGVTCTVGGTSAVTAFNSATQITITTPAKAAGQYTVAVTNPDGGTISQANFIQYSGVPVWSTASGNIGSVQSGSTASFQVTATEGSDTIEYAVTTGSLPSGLSLNTNTGAITGTAGSVSASTTTTFSITATDDENQTSSARSFNITVTPDIPSNHFNTVLYTGTNTNNQSITGTGFQPDLMWVKSRDFAYANVLADSVRGAASTKMLISDFNGEEGSSDVNYANAQAYGYISSFDADGFSVASGTSNGAYTGMSSDSSVVGSNYVAWCFKAGGIPTATNAAAAGSVPTLGSVMVDGTASTSALAGNVVAKKMSVNTALDFSVVDFTSVAGSTNQIPHGLSGTPDLFIFKRTDAAQDWYVYTEVIDGSLDYLVLNSSAPKSNSSETAPTATTVYQPTSTGARDYILYCFKSQPGFSKVGSYTGNNGTNNIQTGFEPAFLLIKNTAAGSTNNWIMVDNKRSPVNQRKQVLNANLANAESTETVNINFLTNGFQLTNGNSAVNDGSGTYIYLAFAADPSTTTPSLANSFATELMTGNGSSQTVNTGFKPDFIWQKFRNISYDHNLMDSVRSNFTELLQSNTNASQSTNTGVIASTSNTGFTTGTSGIVTSNGQPMVFWSWKAGGLGSINTDGTITSVVSANQAAGFSIVKYTGNSTVGATIGHGLGVKPELFFIKNLTATSGSRDWVAWCNTNNQELGFLNYPDAFASSRYSWALNSTQPTSTNITFSNDPATNGSFAYIVYCFKSISGYSKVGTYTGNGTLGHSISVGFAPGFVMLTMISSSGDWYMFDNKRTTGVYSDQLIANSSAAEATGTYVDLTSTGFDLNTTLSSINNNGETFIYLAIKEN